MEPDLDRLEGALGYRFTDRALLRRALVHASTDAPRVESYERLEFLGDRVLGLAIAELLYDSYPTENEGALAKRYTQLVRAETLGRVARTLDLGAFIVMSPAEEDAGGRDNTSILSDVCEAVLAAVYRDGGLAAAVQLVQTHFTPLMAEDLRPPKDAKTTLQEWAQGGGRPLPLYEEVERTGPAHEPVFKVSVTVEGEAPAVGTGTSKRLAEQEAADVLLQRIAGERGKPQ